MVFIHLLQLLEIFNKCALLHITRCLMVNLPPQALWVIDKKDTFFQFLIFFTFARRTKKITFFFVRNLTKTCRKKLIFHFLTLKSHFLNLRFLHYVLRRETENKVKKKKKKGIFF